MYFARLNIIFIIFYCLDVCFGVPVRINFEKCDFKGFTCRNSIEIAGKHDLTFKCNTSVTTQDIQIYLWQFNSVGTITSLTIEDCERVELSFTCTGENKAIQWLKLKNITTLEIMQTTVTHNPPIVIFENVSNIENLRSDTFTQIKKTFFKPGCFIPITDLHSIVFKDVNINTIENGAFKNLTEMKKFVMENVSVNRIEYGAIKLIFEPDTVAVVKNSDFGVMEPLAFQIVGDSFSMLESRIEDMWGSSLNGTIYDLEFTNNTVNNIQAGAIAVLAKNVYMSNNYFRNVESGAFRKISPGLLHDSKRNFGTLYFSYYFNNNLLEHVEDYGIRPDIEAYKNVATHINYTENTLQCSCEAVSWLGADVDLGFGHSVLRDFNTMILEPANKNNCNFNPCMCFGVRSPNKKGTAAATVF